jgi:dTMP kinase
MVGALDGDRSQARGCLVVFEGIDGAGSTTQLTLLAGWLRQQGVDLEVTREPSGGPLGAVLRQVVDGRCDLDAFALALAFAADRADHLGNRVNGVRALLDQGRWVLCDRYVLSSLAYQRGEAIDWDWLRELNRHALEPDVTVLVDTSVPVAAERIARRSSRVERFHEQAELERTRANYRSLVDAGDVGLGRLIVVGGDGDADSVFGELLAQFAPWFEAVAGAPGGAG